MRQKTSNRPKRKYPSQTMGKKELKLIHRRWLWGLDLRLKQLLLGEKRTVEFGSQKSRTLAFLDRHFADF